MSYGSTEPTKAHQASRNGRAPSISDESAAGARDLSPTNGCEDDCNEQRQTPSRWRSFKSFYQRNIGLFLVLTAQVFGSLMTMMTRLLETGFETKFHALQIIFVRMLATTLCGLLYMWYKNVTDWPFGDPSIRGLLVLRGTAGFVGLAGAYYALSFLNISDATVISFLTPIMTAFLCFVFLREPFTIREGFAAIIALTGVVFIARPEFLFPHHHDEGLSVHHARSSGGGGLVPPVPVTPAQRSLAVLLAVLGALSAAVSYSTIRVIGKRAHSLVSVNYFAMLATFGSCLIILIHPNLQFQLPQNLLQWALLVAIGISGFLLQFLLTEGLQREKGGRATNIIYTQLVFALILERIVWGTTPSGWSLGGGALIITAAVLSSTQKKVPSADTPVQSGGPAVDEESPLLRDNTVGESRQ